MSVSQANRMTGFLPRTFVGFRVSYHGVHSTWKEACHAQ
jgi:hypothetical protein